MTLRLHSIDQAPAALPIWQTILDDLGDPPAKRVAKVLAVSERSVYRWRADGHAPKAAAMALFWLTRWGRSQIDAQACNDARVASGLAQALTVENAQLKAQLRQVLALQTPTGAANSPLLWWPHG